MAAVLGSIISIVRSDMRPNSLYLIWPIAALVTALLFFNVHVIHDYYQLPFVFIVCFYAGYFLDWFFDQLAVIPWDVKHLPFASQWRRMLVGLVLALALGLAYREDRIPFAVDFRRSRAGQFIQKHAASDGFVVYVVAKHENDTVMNEGNPYYLWLSRRAGITLNHTQFSRSTLTDISARLGAKERRVFLFCQSEIRSIVEIGIGDAGRNLVAESDVGVIYEIRRDAIQQKVQGNQSQAILASVR